MGMGSFSEFPEHRHADFEFNFCIDGEFDIVMDKETFHVTKGCTTVIPSMCAHAVPAGEGTCKVITLILGMSLLKKYFGDFSKLATVPAVYDLNTPEMEKIKNLFLECADILRADDPGSELVITGNVYKISAYFLKTLSGADKTAEAGTDFRKIKDVEKALEIIYYRYKEPVTVEYAAELTGYSKSSFCKIFKTVVGESFHQALNRQRVNNAAGLLKVSNMSVADIAAEVGFNEAKAFCRVFKSVYGVTPGEYRRGK